MENEYITNRKQLRPRTPTNGQSSSFILSASNMSWLKQSLWLNIVVVTQSACGRNASKILMGIFDEERQTFLRMQSSRLKRYILRLGKLQCKDLTFKKHRIWEWLFHQSTVFIDRFWNHGYGLRKVHRKCLLNPCWKQTAVTFGRIDGKLFHYDDQLKALNMWCCGTLRNSSEKLQIFCIMDGMWSSWMTSKLLFNNWHCFCW